MYGPRVQSVRHACSPVRVASRILRTLAVESLRMMDGRKLPYTPRKLSKIRIEPKDQGNLTMAGWPR
ncbi:unnamed protein product [Nezara viridula]|uniref:Uncharacterized protein n=1 Tax=Nezara viridula TaxID=85310 RepID=A0A9P0DYT8_NEZVI|nr:unnamed protein product [Nezara viridula]